MFSLKKMLASREEAGERNRAKGVRLRLMRSVYITDAWDGETTCSDGVTRLVILYGSKVVYRVEVLKDDGSTVGRRKLGDPFWDRVFKVANVHVQVAKICHIKYHGLVPPARENWDRVHIQDVHLKTLLEHPDNLELEETFGVRLMPLGHDEYRVEISKSALKTSA